MKVIQINSNHFFVASENGTALTREFTRHEAREVLVKAINTPQGFSNTEEELVKALPV